MPNNQFVERFNNDPKFKEEWLAHLHDISTMGRGVPRVRKRKKHRNITKQSVQLYKEINKLKTQT